MSWRKRCTPFQRKVYEAALKIPKGQVRSYAQIARAVGSPQAARAVGQALKRNRWAPAIPCHRVIASDGSLGGYSAPGGLRAKRRRLRLERSLYVKTRSSLRRQSLGIWLRGSASAC